MRVKESTPVKRNTELSNDNRAKVEIREDENKEKISNILKDLSKAFKICFENQDANEVSNANAIYQNDHQVKLSKSNKFYSPKKNNNYFETRESSEKKKVSRQKKTKDFQLFSSPPKKIKNIHLTFTKGPKKNFKTKAKSINSNSVKKLSSKQKKTRIQNSVSSDKYGEISKLKECEKGPGSMILIDQLFTNSTRSTLSNLSQSEDSISNISIKHEPKQVIFDVISNWCLKMENGFYQYVSTDLEISVLRLNEMLSEFEVWENEDGKYQFLGYLPEEGGSQMMVHETFDINWTSLPNSIGHILNLKLKLFEISENQLDGDLLFREIDDYVKSLEIGFRSKLFANGNLSISKVNESQFSNWNTLTRRMMFLQNMSFRMVRPMTSLKDFQSEKQKIIGGSKMWMNHERVKSKSQKLKAKIFQSKPKKDKEQNKYRCSHMSHYWDTLREMNRKGKAELLYIGEWSILTKRNRLPVFKLITAKRN